MKIGFIGSSNISRFHIEAIRNNDFTIEGIGTTFNSNNCRELSESLNLKEKYCVNGWKEVLNKEVDAFCLCIKTSETAKILNQILKIGKPVLVEKPVSFDYKSLENLVNNPMKEKIFVGYNRRFYETLRKVKKICSESKHGGTVVVNLPDSGYGIEDFLNNSCHMIDSLRYILGDFEIVKKILMKEKNDCYFSSISALCKNERWSILINIKRHMPSNYSININSDNLVYELKPLEKLTIFKGLRIIEPTMKEPIRRYVPNIISTYSEENFLKPGFDKMYKTFAKFIENKDIDFCCIDDAKKTMKICCDLIYE